MPVSRYAVFGHPVAHSLSPAIHADFGKQTGIALDYTAIDAAPEEFTAALERFAADGGKGANVTLPLKEAAFALSASLSDRARGWCGEHAGAQRRPVAGRQHRWRRPGA